MLAARNSSNPEVITALIKGGADAKLKDNSGWDEKIQERSERIEDFEIMVWGIQKDNTQFTIHN